MGRPLSTTMQNILAASRRSIDSTLQLTFPDSTVFRFASAPVTVGGNVFTNDLESVSEMRHSLETSIDSVSVAIQNKDRVLGLHVAQYWQKWRNAEVVIGRQYKDKDGLGLTDWIEVFRGAVQRPNANDQQVTFDIYIDTVTPGQIVCNHTLALPCFWRFKDPKTCAYTGLLTTCNHLLKSPGGCDGRANTHHFGGMEHRYSPDSTEPGTTGNTDPGTIGPIGQGPCPRLDQYVKVKGPDGEPIAKMVCFFTEEDELWQPIVRRFRKTKSATIIRDQPIWELIASNGAVSYSSFSHRLIRELLDEKGTPAEKLTFGNVLLTEIRDRLELSHLSMSIDSGERADVMRIEMECEEDEENIYCAGDSPEKMYVCHNSKPVYEP
jgi:hypothetical protein